MMLGFPLYFLMHFPNTCISNVFRVMVGLILPVFFFFCFSGCVSSELKVSQLIVLPPMGSLGKMLTCGVIILVVLEQIYIGSIKMFVFS